MGTSEYYTGATGTENFGLRAVVVDQTMTERAAAMPVDVGGALIGIDGPDWAYLYTNGPMMSNATWTAVVQGGTPPFTYQWYGDGWATGGNTSSHTEHIDERVDFTLRVEITDATGKTAVDQKFVRVGAEGLPDLSRVLNAANYETSEVRRRVSRRPMFARKNGGAEMQPISAPLCFSGCGR